MVGLDLDAAYECARTGERLVERQFRMHQTMLDRASSLTRVTVAELGGVAAISGYAMANRLLDYNSTILIILSVVAGVLTAFMGIRVAVGTFRRRMLSPGPSLQQLNRSLQDDEANIGEIFIMLINAFEDASVVNSMSNERAQRVLVAASYSLAISATFFLSAIIYIVTGFMS